MDESYNLMYPANAKHVDGASTEVLELTHDHWHQFPPQHPMVSHVVGIAYIILSAINLFGNGSVIYIFLKVIKIVMMVDFNCCVDVGAETEDTIKHVCCKPCFL